LTRSTLNPVSGSILATAVMAIDQLQRDPVLQHDNTYASLDGWDPKRYDYDKYRVNRCIHDDDGSPSGCQKHYSTAKKNNRRYDENLEKVNGRNTWSH
jgi:hypothetical protein